MWRNNKPVDEMNAEEIKANLKPILIDIRLLQRTCQMADSPWMRPRKFSDLTLSQAQSKQRELIVEMKKLSIKLSDEDLDSVVKAADREAEIQVEVTAGAPSLGGFRFK